MMFFMIILEMCFNLKYSGSEFKIATFYHNRTRSVQADIIVLLQHDP